MSEWWQDAARVSMLDQLLPDWAKRAACAEQAPNRAPWNVMFADEIAMSAAGPEPIRWPAKVCEAMQMCAGCPVRLRCLAYAYECEQRERNDWWSSELEPMDVRFGVYGGIPGPVREWFADSPDPEAACDDWFRKFAAKKRWDMNEKKGREVA